MSDAPLDSLSAPSDAQTDRARLEPASEPTLELAPDLAPDLGPELALEALGQGDVFAYLRDNDAERRAGRLARIVQSVREKGTHLVWTGNPLRSAFTIERLMLQAAGPDADLRLEHTPEELTDMLAASHDGKRLVIVQQAETLDAAAREALEGMAPFLQRSAPGLSFLFCGSEALKSLGAATPTSHPPGSPSPASPARASIVDGGPDAHDMRRKLPRAEAMPLLLLVAISVSGALILDRLPSRAAATDQSRSVANSAALATVPAPTTSPEPPPPVPQTRVTIDMLTLRQEFDRFLAEQPRRFAALTPEQRDSLFEEFVQRSRKGAEPRL